MMTLVLEMRLASLSTMLFCQSQSNTCQSRSANICKHQTVDSIFGISHPGGKIAIKTSLPKPWILKCFWAQELIHNLQIEKSKCASSKLVQVSNKNCWSGCASNPTWKSYVGSFFDSVGLKNHQVSRIPQDTAIESCAKSWINPEKKHWIQLISPLDFPKNHGSLHWTFTDFTMLSSSRFA